MNSETRQIAVPGGRLRADVYSPERADLDVLCVHGAAYCGDVWDGVARAAADRGLPWRLVTVDLRGHGHSTAGLTDPDQLWEDLDTVAAATHLGRPLLLTHDFGGIYGAAHAVAHPEAVCGIVALEYPLFDHRGAQDYLAAVHSDEVIEMLAERFLLGRAGPVEELGAFMEELVDAIRADWITEETGLGRATQAAHRMVELREDGSWVRKPTTETMATITSVTTEDASFPDACLADRVPVPMWFLHAAEGMYQDQHDRLQAVCDGRDDREVHVLQAGHLVHETDPDAIVDVVERFVIALPRR